MRVVDEHKCDSLEYQNHDTEDIMAVHKLVDDKENEVIDKGWFLINYGTNRDIAFGICYCPYCGKKLRN